MNPWMYNGEIFKEQDSEGWLGFVYVIHNLVDDKKYIGKKLFFHKGHRQVKGKKKKALKVSDWMSYMGSSNDLLEDIKKHGEDCFTREIIHLCRTKGETSYLEAREQFNNDALLKPNKYYNSIVNLRCSRIHLPKDMLI